MGETPTPLQNMANRTFTKYAFVSTKEHCQDLFGKLKELKKKKLDGCGHLVKLFGGDPDKIPCRGFFYDFQMVGDTRLDISLDFAWAESPEFRDFIKSQYSGARIYYFDYEPGCGVCYTNDINDIFGIEYIVDSEEKGEEWYDNLDDVAKYVSEIVGHPVEATEAAIEKAIKDWEEENSDSFISLHHFTYVDD